MKTIEPKKDVKKQSEPKEPSTLKGWYDPMNWPMIIGRYL
jgi:hypothetical protein